MTTIIATTTATANVDDLVSKLKTKLAALGDGRDARSDNERAAYRRDYDAIQGTISGLMNAPDDVSRFERRLADVEAARAETLAKQRENEQAVATAPDPHSFADARQRDAAHDRLQHLKRQRELLAAGQLLKAPGEFFASPADLDARIAELTDRRDRARRALDGYMQQAETLLKEQPAPQATETLLALTDCFKDDELGEG